MYVALSTFFGSLIRALFNLTAYLIFDHQRSKFNIDIFYHASTPDTIYMYMTDGLIKTLYRSKI